VNTALLRGDYTLVQIEPNLVPLLRMLVDGKEGDHRILSVGTHNRCASHLREDLEIAECKREALHVAKNDPMRARMKFHNLRDTCLTHMAVRRDPPQDVQWRAGHVDDDRDVHHERALLRGGEFRDAAPSPTRRSRRSTRPVHPKSSDVVPRS
jgi:hypothetical protein